MNSPPACWTALTTPLLLLLGPAFSFTDLPSSSEAKRAAGLVRQLGSDSFAEREQASAELQKMGLAARSALVQGKDDVDLEIRRRCLDLLPAILEIDLQNRVAAFVADKEGKSQHDVPLWQRYRKTVGEDPAARQLFCEMLQGDTLYFLLDCAEYPDRQREILERYCRKLQQRLYGQRPGMPAEGLTRGHVAAALFVGGEFKGNLQQLTAFMLSGLLYQPVVRTSLNEGPTAPPFKAVLLRWMNNQTNENVILQLTQLIQNLQLKEGVEYLATVIREKKVRGIFLAQAAISLARMGNRDQVPVLETLLDDRTAVGQIRFNAVLGVSEVRDVALGMLVHLTGQSHKDYGFAFAAQQPGLLFSPYYLGFTNDQQREAAHKKWKDWSAAQKK